jgi:hypothetical protein
MNCNEMRDIAPEVALGALSGSERAAALNHLETCSACRELVDELAGVADGLLTVGPEMEPPIGFESGVMARIGGAAPAAPAAVSSPTGATGGRRTRRPLLVGVAAAALVVAGFAGGLVTNEVRTGDGKPKPAPVRVALAYGSWGHPVCQVFAHPGDPSLLVVNVDSPGEIGTYSVDLLTTKGTVPLGTIQVTDGKGSLGAVADVDLATAKSVRLIEGDGHVLYEAVFKA